MFATLKSEFKKLLTVRSTYFLSLFVLLFASFLAIYAFGYKADAASLKDPSYISSTIYNILGIFTIFSSIIAILLVCHEYRYNTISYTLTAARSRLSVLASKLIVAVAYTLIIGLAVTLIAYAGVKLGVGLRHGAVLGAQHLPLWDTLWHYGAYVLGYGCVALILALLTRSVVVAIVALFVVPTIEQILANTLMKTTGQYLPFRSLDAIAHTSIVDGRGLTHLAALGVFAIYLAVLGTVAVVLFVKRDAN